MRSLDVSRANFENQRKVVEEEYRMRVSNARLRARAPSASRSSSTRATGPTSTRPSDRWPTSTPPSSSGCRRSTGPTTGRTTPSLVVAGDFDAGRGDGARPQVLRRHPAGSPSPPSTIPALPEQTSPRTAVDEGRSRALARRPPTAGPSRPSGSPDHYALDVLGAILGGRGELAPPPAPRARQGDRAAGLRRHGASGAGPTSSGSPRRSAAGPGRRTWSGAIEAEIRALATRGPDATRSS